MSEIRKAQMEEVRGILTPEQQEKMKEMRKEGRENNKQ
jgi:Spy/CpxP family protein refolding chaperone